MNLYRLSYASLLLLAIGCSTPEGEMDAAPNDASMDSGALGDTAVDGRAGDAGSDGGTDGGVGDTGGDFDAGGMDSGPSGFPTVADYIPCERDSDCPNAVPWQCVTELVLSHTDEDGRLVVSISDIDPTLTGVCTLPCTDDGSACDALNFDSVDGTAGFTCQLIWEGTSPYPSGSVFPFADELDVDEMNEGPAFAALCMPPFALDPARDASFCDACSDGIGCASGLCWDALRDAADPGDDMGICVESCGGVTDCPFGFACEDRGGFGNVCVPTTGTCGGCADLDGDERGAGHCPQSATDCDDRDALAYWDPENEDHPFPTYCGIVDLNCNGLSDSAELLTPQTDGSLPWGVSHCGACDDPCEGSVLNGSMVCNPDASFESGVCEVVCADPDSWADCDDAVPGCETPVSDPSRLYYRDRDGDGFGDPTDVRFACIAGERPVGYVANDANSLGVEAYDCDDTPSGGAVNPAASEVCDEVDNDCAGGVDDGIATSTWYRDSDGDTYGDPDVTLERCGQPVGYVADNMDCEDTSAIAADIHPGADELCSTDVDDDCDLVINEDNAADALTWYRDRDDDGFPNTNNSQTACTIPSGYIAARADAQVDCADNNRNRFPGNIELCDGRDNDCDSATADDADDPATVGQACSDSGRTGACQTGVSICSGGAPICSQSVFAAEFDDPTDGTVIDEDCDGDESAIYVSATHGTSVLAGSTGTAEDPIQTLTDALVYAATAGRDAIYIDMGAQTLDATGVLVNGVDIVGGFSFDGFTTWTPPSVVASTSVVRSGLVDSDEQVVAFLGQQLSDPTYITRLSVRVFSPCEVSGGTCQARTRDPEPCDFNSDCDPNESCGRYDFTDLATFCVPVPQ